jgi:SAM-dependent methyltransferase
MGELMAPDASTKTIEDFGEQWLRFRDNPGCYGSAKLLADIFGPLLPIDQLVGWRVADIGSGTGRIVNMLLDAGAKHVYAVEPSAAMKVLRTNVASRADQVTCIADVGERVPAHLGLDLVVSIGVIHHIPDPSVVLRAAYAALRPGGKLLIWVYGKEGNEGYLRIALPLRRLTSHVPNAILDGISHAGVIALDLYIWLCRFLPLPMRAYMREVLARFSRVTRRLTIYDQLNPEYAKYYTQAEARDLLTSVGLDEVKIYHRHGYSWTVIGTKPVHDK